jgi:RNase adaptor protein for sRNA GlmZ degradation
LRFEKEFISGASSMQQLKKKQKIGKEIKLLAAVENLIQRRHSEKKRDHSGKEVVC